VALYDIVFADGDPQNFIAELPATSYSGALTDISADGAHHAPGIVLEENLWQAIFEGTMTYAEAMRIMYATLANKSDGGGSATVHFRDKADGKNRITATVDASGNRSAVSVDGT
jgi:hypothetical protein